MKSVPQLVGFPLKDVNRLKAIRKVSVLRSVTNSR